MSPRTLPRSLTMPAIPRSEPFGFAAGRHPAGRVGVAQHDAPVALERVERRGVRDVAPLAVADRQAR